MTVKDIVISKITLVSLILTLGFHVGIISADDRILTVAKSGGEFVSPLSAMNAITDANYYRRYKIKIGPGTILSRRQIPADKTLCVRRGRRYRNDDVIW